jgi:homoisocitrate dehydrogenase
MKGIDMLIVRENTECLYVKDEYIEDTPTGKRAVARRVITEQATRKIAETVFTCFINFNARLSNKHF